MDIHILTTFPDMFVSAFNESIIKKAVKQGVIKIKIHNLRDFTHDKHKSTDGRPYGGGPGMIMLIEPIDKALKSIGRLGKNKTILTSAKGKIYDHSTAQNYSKLDQLIIICGHYEGVDERVSQYLCDEEISIGNYILTGGEIPAMAIVDSTIRLIPGVLGSAESLVEESHSQEGYLEYPQYSRPENYLGLKVPEVLLSGHHDNIRQWRQQIAKKEK